MDSETKQRLLQKYETLPEDLQTLLISDNIKRSLDTIADANDLSEDQRMSLEAEVMLILLGMLPISGFVGSLSEQLDVDYTSAQEIALGVDQEIISNTRESFNRVQELDSRNSGRRYAPDHSQEDTASDIDREPAQQARPQPQTFQTQDRSAQNPKRRPGEQSDPYREPIDEE